LARFEVQVVTREDTNRYYAPPHSLSKTADLRERRAYVTMRSFRGHSIGVVRLRNFGPAKVECEEPSSH